MRNRFLAVCLGAFSAVISAFGPAAARAPTGTFIDLPTATVAVSLLADAQGGTAWASVMAVQTDIGEWFLVVRVCPSDAACNDYSASLSENQYETNPMAGYATIEAEVEGLGLISLEVYSTSEPRTFQICGELDAKSAFVANGELIKGAFAAFGGRIGSWTVNGGSCGFNAWNINLIWLRP